MATVAINTVFLNPDRRGGAETYTRQLVAELQQLDSDLDFLIVTGQVTDLQIDHPRFRVVTCSIDPRRHKQRILFEELRLPGILARLRPDLVHFPYGAMPRRYRGRAVVTIHDTVRHFLPEQLSWLEHGYKRFVDANLIDRAVPVISVSQTDGAAMCEHLGFSCKQIHPVHLGVGEAFREAGRRYRGQPKENYLLWVGRPYDSKNVQILFRAVALLRQRGIEVPLLRLVGPDAQQRQQLGELTRTLGVGDRVSLEPPQPHERLPDLFARAQLFCYPSTHESFGLPVLEATASAVATVVAEHPTFRELHGADVAYCDPHDAEAWATTIARLLGDDALRNDYEQRGWERSRRYSWRACAEQTVAVYRTLLADRARDSLESARPGRRPAEHNETRRA